MLFNKKGTKKSHSIFTTDRVFNQKNTLEIEILVQIISE